MTRYTLSAYPDNSSFAPHMVLREIGVEHRVDWRDYVSRKSAEFLVINPAGQVPSLQTDDGQTVHETAAICVYLAERHPEAGLAPGATDPSRAAFLQWMFYLASTLHMGLNLHAHSKSRWLPNDPAGPVLTQRADTYIGTVLDRIASELATKGPYLLGEKVSVADHYLLMLATWTQSRNSRAADRPALRHFMDLMLARPAVAETYTIEKVSPPEY